MIYLSAHWLRSRIQGVIRRCAGESQTYKNQKSSGFTLVELLLAMGILSILMTVIMKVFIDIIEMRLEAEAESASSQDARFIYSRLAYDINRASAVTIPANPGDSSSTLRLTIGGTAYTYAIDGSGKLTLDDGTGAVSLNSPGTKTDSATFTHRGGATGGQSVTMDIAVGSAFARVQGSLVRRIQTTVGTR